MSKLSRLFVVFAFVVLVQTVKAAPPPNPIIPSIPVQFCPNCGGPQVPLDLGSISATVVNGTGAAPAGNGTDVGESLMNATFSLSAAAKAANVTACANFYWLQEIYYDDAPVKIQGGGTPPVGMYSIIDSPNPGWAYEFDNTTVPPTPKPAYSVFVPRNGPWYYNNAGQAKYNNAAAGTYSINDQPTNPGGTGITRFYDFLVATSNTGCADANCLQPGQIDLLAGFAWTIQNSVPAVSTSSYISAINFIPSSGANGNTGDIQTALSNGGYGGVGAPYTVVTGKSICCPEPAFAGMLMIGGLLGITKRARRAA